MRCTHCGKNNAKYEVKYLAGLNQGSIFLCESCYVKESVFREEDVEVRPMPVVRCPFCGGTMDEYLQTGLVGCAKCYDRFRTELEPHIERLQGGTKHEGKVPPAGEKYEIAVALSKTRLLLAEAEEKRDRALIQKYTRKEEELKALLSED
jgi:protein-arginine kinase activator protein McsA